MANNNYKFNSFVADNKNDNIIDSIDGYDTEDQDLYNEINEEDKDYKPVRKNRKGKTGCLGGIMYFLFVLSISVIIASLTWMAASDVLSLNKTDKTAVITLTEDMFSETTDSDGNTVQTADVNKVASELKSNGIIEYKWLFKLFVAFTDSADTFDIGSYEIKTSYDYRAIVRKMQAGSNAMLTTTITIPEGYTVRQIFQTLDENNICDYDSLMDSAANYDYDYSFLDGKELGNASRLEGYLFPDTYEFYTDMDAESVIVVMLDNFNSRVTADMKSAAESTGYGLDGVLKIASIIEKEAATESDRAIIASVIYNRLNAGMTLGLDSTVLYSYPDHEGDPTEEMLEADDPYNTRIKSGLPPTPISNPGLNTINAALNPSDTDYYYFALDEDSGELKFFTTASEFNAFVATQSYGS